MRLKKNHHGKKGSTMKAGKCLIILGIALSAVYCSSESKKKGGGNSKDAYPYGYSDPNCPNGSYNQYSDGGYGSTYYLDADSKLSEHDVADEGGFGFALQTGMVTWQPTVANAFMSSCALGGCHDSMTRGGGFDYTNEASAQQGLQAAIASVQSGRMPKNNPSFNQTNPQFIQTLMQWQQSLQSGGMYNNTYNGTTTSSSSYNYNNTNCNNGGYTGTTYSGTTY